MAEVNIANNAESYAQGRHTGYEPTALAGIEQSIDAIAAKGIKVAVNGGALNPEGLAMKVAALVRNPPEVRRHCSPIDILYMLLKGVTT